MGEVGWESGQGSGDRRDNPSTSSWCESMTPIGANRGPREKKGKLVGGRGVTGQTPSHSCHSFLSKEMIDYETYT